MSWYERPKRESDLLLIHEYPTRDVVEKQFGPFFHYVKIEIWFEENLCARELGSIRDNEMKFKSGSYGSWSGQCPCSIMPYDKWKNALADAYLLMSDTESN